MRLVRTMWKAMRVAFAEEFWGHLAAQRPLPPADVNRADSPEDLSRRLDAIEARAARRRAKVVELEAHSPGDHHA